MSDINNKKVNIRSNAVRLAECAVFVVLMVIGAFLHIPFFPVLLTFQTVISVLAGLLLGPWYGAGAVLVYIFMGLCGLPVFASGGGFSYVVNPTFGFLLGFAAAAFVSGLIARGEKLSIVRACVAALCGFVVNYLIGAPYFMLIWVYYMHNGNVLQTFIVYVVLYLPKDFVLCLLAAVLAWRVRPLLRRMR